MNKNYIPTPLDAGSQMETSITKTATYNGTTFDRGAGYAPGGYGQPVAAVVNVTAADRANSDETYTFTLQESSDNSTFTDISPAVSVDVSGTSATTGCITIGGFLSQRYVRVKATLAGTTPSITYTAHLSPI